MQVGRSMWLNEVKINDSAISAYRKSLLSASPKHVVIDNLFNQTKLNDIIKVLQQPNDWQTQRHTYSALYVDDSQWQKSSNEQRFVQRDSWQPETFNSNESQLNIAQGLLSYLRSDEFMAVLSRIFNVKITDINVADPEINTNYFRLGTADFVEQHADDSPGREVCMLLYLNKDWNINAGGELVFIGNEKKPTRIAPLCNRCVLFDPFSNGSEHWVEKLNSQCSDEYRYNVTSWYWSE